MERILPKRAGGHGSTYAREHSRLLSCHARTCPVGSGAAMTVRFAIRMVTPRSWTGGANYLLNVCRALREYTADIHPVFFAPADIDASLAQTIAAVTGAPPVTLRERTHKDDALAVLG